MQCKSRDSGSYIILQKFLVLVSYSRYVTEYWRPAYPFVRYGLERIPVAKMTKGRGGLRRTLQLYEVKRLVRVPIGAPEQAYERGEPRGLSWPLRVRARVPGGLLVGRFETGWGHFCHDTDRDYL